MAALRIRFAPARGPGTAEGLATMLSHTTGRSVSLSIRRLMGSPQRAEDIAYSDKAQAEEGRRHPGKRQGQEPGLFGGEGGPAEDGKHQVKPEGHQGQGGQAVDQEARRARRGRGLGRWLYSTPDERRPGDQAVGEEHEGHDEEQPGAGAPAGEGALGGDGGENGGQAGR